MMDHSVNAHSKRTSVLKLPTWMIQPKKQSSLPRQQNKSQQQLTLAVRQARRSLQLQRLMQMEQQDDAKSPIGDEEDYSDSSGASSGVSKSNESDDDDDDDDDPLLKRLSLRTCLTPHVIETKQHDNNSRRRRRIKRNFYRRNNISATSLDELRKLEARLVQIEVQLEEQQEQYNDYEDEVERRLQQRTQDVLVSAGEQCLKDRLNDTTRIVDVEKQIELGIEQRDKDRKVRGVLGRWFTRRSTVTMTAPEKRLLRESKHPHDCDCHHFQYYFDGQAVVGKSSNSCTDYRSLSKKDLVDIINVIKQHSKKQDAQIQELKSLLTRAIRDRDEADAMVVEAVDILMYLDQRLSARTDHGATKQVHPTVSSADRNISDDKAQSEVGTPPHSPQWETRSVLSPIEDTRSRKENQ